MDTASWTTSFKWNTLQVQGWNFTVYYISGFPLFPLAMIKLRGGGSMLLENKIAFQAPLKNNIQVTQAPPIRRVGIKLHYSKIYSNVNRQEKVQGYTLSCQCYLGNWGLKLNSVRVHKGQCPHITGRQQCRGTLFPASITGKLLLQGYTLSGQLLSGRGK